jgi:hypothetical protein
LNTLSNYSTLRFIHNETTSDIGYNTYTSYNTLELRGIDSTIYIDDVIYNDVANLIFNALPSNIDIIDGNLTIIKQPLTKTSCDNVPVEFSIECVGGIPPYTYNWVVNGSNVPFNTSSIKFLTSLEQNGMVIYCTVIDNNGHSVTSDYAKLYVIECDDECLTTYYMGGPYNLLCHIAGNGKSKYYNDHLKGLIYEQIRNN